jgi:hypothetical protein
MANQTLKIYNADEVDIVVGAVLVNSGFADGEFLRVEQESNDTEDVVGTDGEVSVSRTNDQRATFTILLMQTSDANDGLSAYHAAARSAPGMTGAIFPLLVKDKNGRALYETANAWVQRAPDLSFDRTAQTREWTIRGAHFTRFDGGN